MRKHREAVVRANQSVNGEVKKLAPPRMAPTLPGVHAPSHIPSHAASYAQPYDQQFVSRSSVLYRIINARLKIKILN